MLSAAGESLVQGRPTGAPLLAAEGGDAAFSFVSRSRRKTTPPPPNLCTSRYPQEWPSSSDRAIGGAGVLVSTDGSTFTNAVVLKFDGATATNKFKVWVKAIDDSAAEGPRVALISHSIVTGNPTYEGLPLLDVFVNVVDNDKPGLDIRHLIETAPGVFATDTNTQVLEGASGFGDAYSVALTAKPVAGETVTVNLVTDGQITPSPRPPDSHI